MLVCLTTENIPGDPRARRDRCELCGAEVWIAPSSEVLFVTQVGMMVTCLMCAQAKIKKAR